MLYKFLPFLGWFRGYSLEKFKLDAVAGLTVALVLIPQSMAYAQLAGLPPYYGLYAAFLPPLIAALFGSSRQLATGPVAVVSLMTATSLAPLATQGSEGYVAYAILLALLVGLFQLLLGVLRLGLVVNFLSHPVVNGFTNAAAIIIATSQLSKMFGVSVDASPHYYQTIVHVIGAAVHYTHWPTLLIGVFAFALMFTLKRINPRIPNVLVAVALCTVISWAVGFQHDAAIPLNAIRDAAVAGHVEAFNRSVAVIQEASQQRTDLSLARDRAEADGNFAARVDLDRGLALINHTIDETKAIQRQERAALRELLFDGVAAGDGSLTLYRKDALPSGVEGDGRTWRIRVGNTALKADAIPVMGGGAVVGVIPSGLPALVMPHMDLGVMLKLLPSAVIITLLGFMEAISIAKAMAAKTGQRLDPNQELIGQGLGNILGSVGQSYPVSGSFSRSAVNLQAGAVTGLSSVFTAAMVVVALLFLTPLLYHLPQAVLAAVIMMAVIGLINASGFVHAWHAKWYDGLISIITFICTLGFAPHLDKGIMIGVVLSLGVFLYKSMRPRLAILSRADDLALRDAQVHGLQECAYVDVLRFDGPLFFANSSFLEDKITEQMRLKPQLKHIILAAHGMADVDASGEDTLSLLIDRCRSAGVDVSLAGVNESVYEVLKRTHLLEKIGEDHIHPTVEQAVCAMHPAAHAGEHEDCCPLTTVCHLV